MALSHNSLENYFKTNFALMKHHQFSLTEIESWMPWEREVYVSLLLQYLEEQEMKERQRRANKKSK